jgi:hypothetical protein
MLRKSFSPASPDSPAGASAGAAGPPCSGQRTGSGVAQPPSKLAHRDESAASSFASRSRSTPSRRFASLRRICFVRLTQSLWHAACCILGPSTRTSRPGQPPRRLHSPPGRPPGSRTTRHQSGRRQPPPKPSSLRLDLALGRTPTTIAAASVANSTSPPPSASPHRPARLLHKDTRRWNADHSTNHTTNSLHHSWDTSLLEYGQLTLRPDMIWHQDVGNAGTRGTAFPATRPTRDPAASPSLPHPLPEREVSPGRTPHRLPGRAAARHRPRGSQASR